MNTTGMDTAPARSDGENARKDQRAAKATCVLYAVFFAMWCIGLFLGLYAKPRMLLGMPLWFTVSCILSYVIICLALLQVIRRYFR